MSSGKSCTGTIESVISNYGQISIDDECAATSKAFFDFESVGNATDDLTKHFKVGMKVKAKLKTIQKDGDNTIKAYSVVSDDINDPAIRGGDIYLKKLLERVGPQELDSMPKILMEQTDNCPKFLKSNKTDGIKKIVLSRPDWFQISNELDLLLLPIEENARVTLLSILRKKTSIPINEFQTTISKHTKINKYLTDANLSEFVFRYAESFVIWKDSLWSYQSLLEDTEDGNQFQNDMMAVKYYSQFIVEHAKVDINILRGHYSQASKTVQQAVKSKDPDFRLFWKRNNFFFNVHEENTVSCHVYRLPILDQYRSPCVDQNLTMNSSPISSSVAETSVNSPITRSNSDYEHAANGIEIQDMVKEYIIVNGAINLLDFHLTVESNEGCHLNTVEQLSTDKLQRLAENCPSLFSVRYNYLCLNSQENSCIGKLSDFLKLSPSTVADLKLKFAPYPEMTQYIFNCKSDNAIYDFISRNPDRFLFMKNSIYLCKQILGDSELKECFKAEMQAVQYYTKFIRKNCPTPIISVCGHYAQATTEIRNVAHSRRPDFVEFLKRNDFFFEVSDESVKMTDKHFENLRLIEKWLDPDFYGKSLLLLTAPSIRYQSNTNQAAQNSSTTCDDASEEKISLTPSPKNRKDIVYPIQESRAFIEEMPLSIEESPSSDEPYIKPVSVLKNNVLLQDSISNQPLSTQGFGLGEMFQNILGDGLCIALRERLSVEDCVNNLILLRLHVGAPMKAFFWDAITKSPRKETIGTKIVEQVDVNRVLRSADVIKIGETQHYGIKGTLHTISVMKQNGEVCEVNIFYQIHFDSDGLVLDMKKGPFLHAVFPGQYPDKWIYNFLRSRSKKLSESKDVLILDMYGKLSGCDEKPHSTLGDDVTRIICTESDLAAKILHAIPLKRQYVIITGVDSLEQLTAVEKMCGRGIVVIAEVSNSLKSKVEQLL